MKDQDKTKEQLINELVELRQRVAELEATETEHKRAEEEIRQRNRELAALNAIATVVSQSLNLDEILNAALDKVLEFMHLDVGGIYLADLVRRKLDLVVHRGISKEFAHQIGSISVDEKTLEAVTAEGKLGRFIFSVKAVTKDRVELKRVLSAVRKEGLSLTFGVPVLLQAREEVLGLMIVASRVPRQYSKAELGLLTSIGQQIAVAIQNARLFEEEKRRITQLALINEVGEKAASILDLDRLTPEVTRSIQERFNYYNVALFLLDEGRREVVMQAVAGGFEHMAPGEYRQSLDEGIIGFVARTGKSWLASDVSQDPYYVKGFLEEVLTKSELCIPVKLGDKVIGALDVQSIHLNDFDQSDVTAMEAVADRLAIAIENVRLFEEARRRLHELESLAQASAAIVSTLELHPRLEDIFNAAMAVVPAVEKGSILLLDEATGELAIQTLIGYSDPRIRSARFPREAGYSAKAVREGRPLLIPDARADPSICYDGEIEEIRAILSAAVVPLQVKGRIIGVIALDNASRKAAFNEDDLRLLTTFADQAAIAIENARLYERAQQEITERKQAEEALRESEERYRAVVESQTELIDRWRPDGTLTFVNEAYCRYYGQPREELIGHKWMMHVAEEDQERVKAYVEHLMTSLSPANPTATDEHQEVAADGSIRWQQWIDQALFDEQGHLVEVQSVGRDITERKRAEAALTEERNLLRTLIDNLPDLIYAKDTESQYTVSNIAHVRFLGATKPDEVIGKSVFELYPQELAAQYYADDQEVIRSGQPLLKREERSVDQAGNSVWHLTTKVPLRDSEGKVVGLVGIARDITERKRAEEELIRLSNAVRMSTDSIVIGDLEAKIIDVNEATLRMYGTDDKGDLVGKNSFDLIAPEDREKAFVGMEETLERGYTEGREYHIITKDGSKIPVEMNAALMKDADGNPIGFVSVSRDITERKRGERLLQGLNQAALAMERALTPEEIFAAVARELKKLGFSCVVFLTDESQSRLFVRHFSYEAGAIKALEKLTGLKVENFSLPIETADVYRKVVQERKAAFIENVEDVTRQFLPKPLKKFAGQIVRMLKIARSIPAPLIVEDKVIGLLSVESDDLTERDIPAITAFAHQMAAAWRKATLLQDLERSLAEVERAQEELRHSYAQLRRTFDGTIHVLVSAIEMRDPYTAGHQRRVTQLVCAIAKEIGLPEEQIEGLRMAGLIHDIGKISVPAEVLSKPGPLSDLQYGLIQAHTQVGYDVLNGAIDFPWPVAQIVLQHHERMDGSGYPQGLSGEEIVLEARILAVADVVEAMASHRPYRPAHGIDKALEEISQNRGVLYDPHVVDACLKLFTEKGFRFE